MATDNTQINAGTGGDIIATDDILTMNGATVATGTQKAQRMKVGFGSDSIFRDVDTSNPLPVGGGFVSTANSSSATLGANTAFTGTAEDISQYASVTVSVYASHVSGTDGLQMQQSPDGTNWDNIDAYNIPATTGKTFGVQIANRFFRVVYTNGATAQTAFRIQTIYHMVAIPTSSVRPQDGRGNDNDMEENLAYMMSYNGTTWDRTRSINGAIQIAGSQASAPSTGSWTSATAAGTVVGTSVAGYNTVSIALIQGSTITAGVVTFEVSMDNTNWLPIAMNRIDIFTAGITYNLTASTNVGFTGSVDAYNYFRVRLSTVISGTGTIAVALLPQAFPIEPTTTVGQTTASLLNATAAQGAAGGTPWLYRHAAATTSSGLLPTKILTTASVNNTSVKTTAAAIYGWHLVNTATSARYVRFYNLATTATMGTSSPAFVIPLPASGGAVMTPATMNFALSTGFTYAITAGATDLDNTSTAANDVVGTIWYI